MPKFFKVETDYRYYAVDLTDEQYKMYQDDPDAFWDDKDLQKDLCGKVEFIRNSPAGNGNWYYVED